MGAGCGERCPICRAFVQAAIFLYVYCNPRQFRNSLCLREPVDCASPSNLFHESNVTRLKVIAPSYGQTGTTAIIDALRELGLRSYHADDFASMAKAVMYDGIDPTAWANTVSRCRMDAISLEPITDLLPLALSVSPEAKVIMSWRDYNTWILSTLRGGAVKDKRMQYIMGHAQSSKAFLPWFDYWEDLTGQFKRVRMEGNPVFQPVAVSSYIYRSMCNAYGWPAMNVYNRGVFKAAGHEEAYLAHLDEIRRITPPGRLLEFDVKRHTWKHIEDFLGLPPRKGNAPLPKRRSAASRTNDPMLDLYPHISLPGLYVFMVLHAVNYLLITLAVSAACGLLSCCCAPRLQSKPQGRAEDEPQPRAVTQPQPQAAALTSVARGLLKAEERWERALRACPVVAILRGLESQDALATGKALVEAGITIVEVPLNSPRALESIRILAEGLPQSVVVGAGTVLTEEEVALVAEAGGILVVSPNMDEQVIRRTRAMGLVSFPGVATPTEALAALRHGASALKAFPGEQIPPNIIKAWKAILPKGTLLMPVGGVTEENMAAYWSAGASGFGVGSALFRPGDSPETIRKRAEAFVGACPR